MHTIITKTTMQKWIVGVRVKFNCPKDNNEWVRNGATGVLMEDDDRVCPYVKWDSSSMLKGYALQHKNDTEWAVPYRQLELE